MRRENNRLMRRQIKSAKKAISPLLAGVLYIVIGLTTITIVFQVATPAIGQLQDSAAVDQAQAALINLDRLIRLVAAEGAGSTRITTVDIKKGTLFVDLTKQTVFYEIVTPAQVVTPRSRQVLGNLIISNNAAANASETATQLILQNEHLRLVLSKVGNETSFQDINVSRLFESIVLLDTGAELGGEVKVLIDDNSDLETGNGYTKLEEVGTNLGRARAIAHVNNSLAEYDVWFTLESSADFFSVEVKNFLAK